MQNLVPLLLRRICVGLALAACSGATRPIVDEPAGGGGGEGTGSSGGTRSSYRSARRRVQQKRTTSGSNGSSGNGSGNGSGNANGSGSGGGFDSGPAPALCPSGGIAQTGASGDSASDATSFSSTACGTIEAGAVYWWTFTLAPSTTRFGLDFWGHVRFDATSKGATVTVAPGTTLPFDPKDPYVLRVTSAESQSEPYVITVSQQ